MELTKESIGNVRLSTWCWKGYNAKEVDRLLDALSIAAEKQYIELEHLRKMQAEYVQSKDMLSEALLMAQKSAMELMEETRTQCDRELIAMEEKKRTLQLEISSLEQYKVRELERINAEINRLLGDTQRSTMTIVSRIAE